MKVIFQLTAIKVILMAVLGVLSAGIQETTGQVTLPDSTWFEKELT